MMSLLPDELLWDILAHSVSHENNFTTVKPPSERLYPLFPGHIALDDTAHHAERLAMWKDGSMVARNCVQVNRLWRCIAEEFLYSAFYFEEELCAWKASCAEMFIDTIKLNPNLAGQLCTLTIMRCVRDLHDPFRQHFEQVLSLCHSITAIFVHSHLLEGSLPLFQSPESEWHLLLLSALELRGEGFQDFMRNANHYANLQVLELSSNMHSSNLQGIEAGAETTAPITFPSLCTLLLGDLDLIALNVIEKWKLPSLKELGLYQHGDTRTSLYPMIQQAYKRLEFLDANVGTLHHLSFRKITQAPPPHLKNLTLLMTTTHLLPPMHPATKPFFHYVVTLGIGNFTTIKKEDEPAWVQFFSDQMYMPHLRSVLTDMTLELYSIHLEHPSSPVMEVLHSLEKVLSNRGVAFKGMMDDCLSFFLMRLHFFNETLSRSACPCFVID